MNKITAIQTNDGTLFVDIGRARFNDLFDKCPVVALNTAEGQSIYRRTADWTNQLDAYSLFTFEFRGTGNADEDYVTYKCNGGSCEIAEVREWLDLEDIKSRTDNPEIHLYLFPASKCPTSFDVNILPCDAVPETFTMTRALRDYGDKLVLLKQQATADITLKTQWFTHVGCFIDDSNRDLDGLIVGWGHSPESCSIECKDYDYFAIQAGNWCVCDNSYNTEPKYHQVDEDECHLPQYGPGQGGNWRNSVYAQNKDVVVDITWELSDGRCHDLARNQFHEYRKGGQVTGIDECKADCLNMDECVACECSNNRDHCYIRIPGNPLGSNEWCASTIGEYTASWCGGLSAAGIAHGSGNDPFVCHAKLIGMKAVGFELEVGVHYGHGSNIGVCGIYNTHAKIEAACKEDITCVGYSTITHLNTGAEADENGQYPWCLKSTETLSATSSSTQNYYHKIYKESVYVSDVLGQCQEWGTLSKHDNGCLAYHRGWKQGDNECHSCGETSRNYAACDLEECELLCEDLYSENLSQLPLCRAGCQKYHDLGGCLGKREPADVLTHCEGWGTLSTNHNGCRAYHGGWEKGDNDCDRCGETSRNYEACDLDECELMCEDLYSNDLSQLPHCKEGCQKYHELGGCLGIITTQLNRISDITTEVTIAGEIEVRHAGCAWDCTTDASRIEVSQPSTSACTKLASQRGSDFFAIDNTGACLFPDSFPDVFAFEGCPMSHTCTKDYYTVAKNWDNFECSAFNPVLDKNSQAFQSCSNHASFRTQATIIEDCETACNLLSGCSYFIFTQSLSECSLFTTCKLSFDAYMMDGVTSVLMRRGKGDTLNDQVPRLISSDETQDTMTVRSPDARDEAYVSCPVGFLVTECLCALDSCKGASISGRYCTAFGDFVAAQATCLRETLVNSHSVVTQDSASFDCGSDTVLGCTCLSKRLDDCDVIFQDGQCRLRPLSTGDTAYSRSCISGSCSDGWQHLQVFDGYMIEIQRSNQRITIPKGSYNVETLRKMLPDDFEWDSFTIVAFTQSDDRHVQAICADVRPNFNAGN